MESWWFRGLVVVFVFLVFSSGGMAAAYSVDVIPVQNDILLSGTATYDVEINNYGEQQGRFQVYTIDPAWNVKSIPVTPIVEGKSQETIRLEVRPTSGATIGAQGLSVTFKDLNTGSLIKKDVIVNLRSGIPTYGAYEPSVELNVMMDFEVDPRDPVPLRLELRNRNSLNITNLSVSIVADHFGTDFTMALPPLSVQTRDISGLSLDPMTLPGDAQMKITVTYQGVPINQLVKNYKVGEYTSIRQNIGDSKFLFKTTKKITVFNDGNVENTAIVTVPVSLLKSLFISSSILGERMEYEGRKVMLWRLVLGPNESATFEYAENYNILFLLIFAVIIAGIAYVLLRSPVLVLKEAVGIAKQDGVSRIKVRIFVRNRSARLIRDLQITDRVPSLADVVKAESPGSISPSKIAVSEKKGTLLRWNMDLLEPYEERVLTYQAKSKLKIIGKMSLPQVKTRFVSKNKERVVFSNNIELVQKFKSK